MAMGGVYSMTFDPATIRRIAALTYAAPVFEGYYLSAMRYSVNLVNQLAQKNAPVGDYPGTKPKQTGGNLRRSIRGQTVTPYLGKVGVLASVPYARRREFGFDGQTDSLGRYYPMDPTAGAVSADGASARSHMFYLHRALQTAQPAINAAWRTSTQLAIKQIIGGIVP